MSLNAGSASTLVHQGGTGLSVCQLASSAADENRVERPYEVRWSLRGRESYSTEGSAAVPWLGTLR